MIQVEKFQAGWYEKGFKYSYFIPEKIRDQWAWSDPELNSLLEKASVRLGELNAFARFVPNVDLFIKVHVTKEAVISSKIEGTQTNLNEALLPEEEIRPDRRGDWHEVRNYVDALNWAIRELNQLPISSRLIRDTHLQLLRGVRGQDKLPGQFRKSQNWIGGASLADATFIPPADRYVDELMSDLEQFIHDQELHIPALIRIAIVHYQFETIHPFLDGNGRIGRLLITLYLISEGILEKPLLYLSSFFEKNKQLYYDNLMRVRTKNDILQWLKYFLIGIEQTASLSISTLKGVLALQDGISQKIQTGFGRRASSALLLVNQLYRTPHIRVDDIMYTCKLSPKASGDLLRLFVQEGWLKEITGRKRDRIYSFEPYIEAFKE